MRFKIFFLLITTIQFTFAQPGENDSTIFNKDSTGFYNKIEHLSKQRKFTQFMYDLIFKPSVSSNNIINTTNKQNYAAYEGKIIRNIQVESIDPFGFSISDTTVQPKSFLYKAGNKLHVKSKGITIRNLLLFHRDQAFDSVLVNESERLVRSQVYIGDVLFFVNAIPENPDSVDIVIRELDKWTINPNLAYTSSKLSVDLTDHNFSGLGHRFQTSFTWFQSVSNYAYDINYYIPNFRNTYINTLLNYGRNEAGKLITNFSIDRPFFSPFARWAAGVNLIHQYRTDYIRINKFFSLPQVVSFNSQDFWAGKAIQIAKGKTENDRATNFVSAARFYRLRYLKKPVEALDTLHMYADETFYLTSFSISTRKYVQDKYIFNYGLIEDVPVGKIFGLIAGYQLRNDTKRLYLGARIAFGNYFPWGYFSPNIEYGTFFHHARAEQGVLSGGFNYFTKLYPVEKWRIRQFAKVQLTVGLKRFIYDTLTINNKFGLEGFNGIGVTGTSRILITLQTQSYSPWKFLGFHFGPYVHYSMGMLGNNTSGFSKSKLYSQLGLGLLIRNENLIFNIFQVSLGFYPIIPGQGQNIFKLNSFKTTDFGFRDFEVRKPAADVFQ